MTGSPTPDKKSGGWRRNLIPALRPVRRDLPAPIQGHAQPPQRVRLAASGGFGSLPTEAWRRQEMEKAASQTFLFPRPPFTVPLVASRYPHNLLFIDARHSPKRYGAQPTCDQEIRFLRSAKNTQGRSRNCVIRRWGCASSPCAQMEYDEAHRTERVGGSGMNTRSEWARG